MRTLIILILTILFLPLVTRADHVKGVLINTEDEPIGHAWVSLFGENEMIARGQTDASGRFLLRNVKEDSYHIMIRFTHTYRMLYFIKVSPGKFLRLRIDPEKENTPPEMHPEFAGEPVDLRDFKLWRMPVTDGFDFPVGKRKHTQGYYVARKFGQKKHLGEDWNGVGGGNSDLGDEVYTVANGTVIYAGDEGPGWGNVIRVLHNTGTIARPRYIESVYAHMDEIFVVAHQRVYRGDRIGTIGNADGMYMAHLHLEFRNKVGLGIGGGYGPADGYLDPTVFIKANRPWK